MCAEYEKYGIVWKMLDGHNVPFVEFPQTIISEKTIEYHRIYTGTFDRVWMFRYGYGNRVQYDAAKYTNVRMSKEPEKIAIIIDDRSSDKLLVSPTFMAPSQYPDDARSWTPKRIYEDARDFLEAMIVEIAHVDGFIIATYTEEYRKTLLREMEKHDFTLKHVTLL